MAEYVTIKEFCKLAQISPQSVYKKIKKPDNQLNNFIKLVDNKKMISLEALKLYQKEESKQEHNEPEPESATDNGVSKELIELLRKELEAKDEQIANLTKLLDQQQHLNLKTMQELDAVREEKQLLLESKTEDAEEGNTKKPWWKIF